MKCNVCGHECQPSEAYCPRCGALLPRPHNRIYRELLWMILLAALAFWLTLRLLL
jgi:predicted nucleic acid-binding Zn ribbon protein